MPGKTTVTFSGAAELEAALKDLGPKAARKIGGKALSAGGEIIADAARAKCPVDTGLLKTSIVVVSRPPAARDERAGAIGFINKQSHIANWVEFGTVKMQAEPFMRPAIDEKGADAITEIGNALWDGIDKEAAAAPKASG